MGFHALILAAGEGTRMKSRKPKVAHEILGKPLVSWVVDAARAAGAQQIFTVVGHGREAVAPLVPDTTLVVQEEQLGTGHALMIAREAVEAACARASEVPAAGAKTTAAQQEASDAQQAGTTKPSTLIVLSGDTPLITADTLKQLAQTHAAHEAQVTVLTTELPDPTGYGRVVRNEQGSFTRIVEHKDATATELALTEINSGVYCFDTSHLFTMLEQLSTNNAQAEYYLPDVVSLTLQAGGRVHALKTANALELCGINDRVQLAAATAQAQRTINERHMRAGVSILDPTTVWIGPDVELAEDVEILPLTTISGHTTVGWGTVIGPLSRVNNSTIGESCVIDDSVLIDSVLEDRVSVGPRAYLRPGTVMRTGSRAGTHVEIKKSDIGAGAKVPHLSYIGDATLGEGVNIGAGSITCNYDGEHKHRTVIGARSFVGSDTMFVAPVTVGEDAVTGAGSVITANIPAGALGVARPQQIIKENWKYKNTTEEENHQ